jgi:hypothetical protein
MAPIDSLERGVCGLHFKKLETDSARFRALGADAVPCRLSGILGHERLQFGLRILVLQKSRSGLAKQPGEFRPGVGRTHVDDPNGLDPRPWWRDAKQTRLSTQRQNFFSAVKRMCW